jgi:hypothetical protein
MRLFHVALAVPLLLFAVACAPAASTTEAAPGAATEPAAEATPEVEAATATGQSEPDVVCTKVEKTGSRIPKRRCTTRAQREEMRKSAEDFMRRAQRPTGVPGN